MVNSDAMMCYFEMIASYAEKILDEAETALQGLEREEGGTNDASRNESVK